MEEQQTNSREALEQAIKAKLDAFMPTILEQPEEHLETQFRVKGKAGRKELCLKLVKAFEGTNAPCCALVVGNPEAVDLWNGGYYEVESGFRKALPHPPMLPAF